MAIKQVAAQITEDVREIEAALSALQTSVQNIDNFTVSVNLSNLGSQLQTLGVAIGGISVVTAAVSSISSSTIQGLKVVEEISKQLIKTAEALRRVDDSVPDFGEIAPKLSAMAIAVGGMGVISVAADALSEQIIEGLTVVEKISNQLVNVAKAMKEVDESVPDFGEIAPKLSVMALAIGGMAIVAVAADALSKQIIDGLIIVEKISNQLVDVAKAMKEVNENVPDFGEIAPKLGVMALAIGGMGIVAVAADALSERIIDGLNVVEKIAEQLVNVAKAMKEVDENVPDFGEIAPKLGVMGIAIGGMGIVAVAADALSERIIDGLIVVEKIAEQLVNVAKAMKEVDESVPDFGEIAPKLGVMALAIGGMGVVAVAAALLDEKLKKGLIIVEMITNQLLITAEAMGKINDKVPDDLGLIVQKLAVMGAAIIAMGAFGAVMGLLVKSGIGAIILVGQALIIGIATSLIKAAEAIDKVNRKVPDDMSSVKNKISELISALRAVASSSVGSVFGLLRAAAGAFQIAILVQTAKNYADAGAALQEIEKVSFNESAVQANITKIKDAISMLQISGEDIGSSIERLLSGAINNKVIEQAREAIENFAAIAEAIDRIQAVEICEALIHSQINKLQGVVSVLQSSGEGVRGSLGRLISGALSGRTIEQAREAIENFAAIAEAVDRIQAITIDTALVREQLDKLSEVIETLNEIGPKIGNELDIDPSVVAAAQEAMDSFAAIVDALERIQEVEIDGDLVRNQIDELVKVIGILNEVGPLIGDELDLDTEVVEQAREAMENFAGIAEAIETIQDVEIDQELVRTQIDQLADVIEILNEVGPKIGEELNIDESVTAEAKAVMENFKAIAEAIDTIQNVLIQPDLIRLRVDQIKDVINHLNDAGESLTDDIQINEGTVEQARNIMNHFKEIAQAIEVIQEVEINPDKIREQIDKLIDVINYLNEGGEELAAEITIDEATTQKAQEVMNHFKSIAQAIEAIQNTEIDPAAVGERIEQMRTIFSELDATEFELELDLAEMAEAVSKLNQVKLVFEAMKQLETVDFDHVQILETIANAKEVLEEMATFAEESQEMADLEHLGESIEQFQEVIEQLQALSIDFEELGESYATQLLEGFNSVNVPEEIVEALSTFVEERLAEKVELFESLGTDYGEGLAMAFAEAVKTLADPIKKGVNQVTDVFEEGLAEISDMATESFVNLGESVGEGMDRVSDNVDGGLDNVEVSFDERLRAVAEVVDTKTADMEERFAELPDELNESSEEAMERFNTALTAGMEKANTTSETNITQIETLFEGLETSLETAGQNAMTGLERGISAGGQRAVTAARNVANDVSQAVASALRINSPSRVMMMLGMYTMEGFALGMKQQQQRVAAVINETANLVEGGIKQAMVMEQRLQKMLTNQDLARDLNFAITSPDQTHQNSLMERLIDAVEAGQHIVMDSGELVGATYHGYDCTAGATISYNSRWGR